MKASHQVQEYFDNELNGRATPRQLRAMQELIERLKAREEAILTAQIRDDAKLKKALDESKLYHQVQAI